MVDTLAISDDASFSVSGVAVSGSFASMRPTSSAGTLNAPSVALSATNTSPFHRILRVRRDVLHFDTSTASFDQPMSSHE